MDPADPETLQALESIRALKYAYFRLLDTKRFTELGELLTAEVTTSYSSGELSWFRDLGGRLLGPELAKAEPVRWDEA